MLQLARAAAAAAYCRCCVYNTNQHMRTFSGLGRTSKTERQRPIVRMLLTRLDHHINYIQKECYICLYICIYIYQYIICSVVCVLCSRDERAVALVCMRNRCFLWLSLSCVGRPVGMLDAVLVTCAVGRTIHVVLQLRRRSLVVALRKTPNWEKSARIS